MCDFEGCSKSYHLHCLGIVTTPKGIWNCPRHDAEDDADFADDEITEPPLKKPKMSKKVKKASTPPKPSLPSDIPPEEVNIFL